MHKVCSPAQVLRQSCPSVVAHRLVCLQHTVRPCLQKELLYQVYPFLVRLYVVCLLQFSLPFLHRFCLSLVCLCGVFLPLGCHCLRFSSSLLCLSLVCLCGVFLPLGCHCLRFSSSLLCLSLLRLGLLLLLVLFLLCELNFLSLSLLCLSCYSDACLVIRGET